MFELARIMGTSAKMIEQHYGTLIDTAHEAILSRLEVSREPMSYVCFRLLAATDALLRAIGWAVDDGLGENANALSELVHLVGREIAVRGNLRFGYRPARGAPQPSLGGLVVRCLRLTVSSFGHESGTFPRHLTREAA